MLFALFDPLFCVPLLACNAGGVSFPNAVPEVLSRCNNFSVSPPPRYLLVRGALICYPLLCSSTSFANVAAAAAAALQRAAADCGERGHGHGERVRRIRRAWWSSRRVPPGDLFALCVRASCSLASTRFISDLYSSFCPREKTKRGLV